jgi:hypothetical protein
MKGGFMFLTITFLLIAMFSLNASDSANNVPAQPHTAQQHFQEIKNTLLATKYTAPKNALEKESNQRIDMFTKLFKDRLQKEEPLFIEKAVPTLIELKRRNLLVIPQDSGNQFKENVKILLEKRNNALN